MGGRVKKMPDSVATENEVHLWVSLLIRYLEEVGGVPQGSLL